MIKISACLIVKNEEAVLKRCLDSLKGIADEIIIVDTGSTDKTKEIAAGYTDQIFDFPWIDDFSAARNFSLSKATKEYIYVADADEVIDEDNRQRFRQLKEVLLPDVEIVQMYYTNQLLFNTTYNFDRELRPKLFKRLRQFRFHEPVHEVLLLEPVVYDSDIEICHMPVSNHGSRDFKIFIKEIKNKGKLSKRLRTMYAKELMIAGGKEDFIAAKEYFAAVMEEAETSEEIKQCQCVLARCARLERKFGEFFKICIKNIAMEKASAEVCYELGEYYRQEKDFMEAGLWYYNAIYETSPEIDIRTSGELAIKGMVSCKEALHQEEEAEHYRKLLTEMKEVLNNNLC